MRGLDGAKALDWEFDLEYNPNAPSGTCLFSGPQLLHTKCGVGRQDNKAGLRTLTNQPLNGPKTFPQGPRHARIII